MSRVRSKGSTTERGYGWSHQQERAKWKPVVASGQAFCHAKYHVSACLDRNRWLDPDLPWDLGHNEDRTAWTGPEFRGCNRSDGAVRGNQMRAETHRFFA